MELSTPDCFNQSKTLRRLRCRMCFIAWDTYAVSHQQWIFPGNGLLGVYIGILPIEEYLFFLKPPYFALTLATVIREKMK